MNQIIKNIVYTKGTRKQALFMAEIGGMNEEETKVFLMLHEGRTMEYIMLTCRLSRKGYERIEESIRAKLLLAVFECINKHMENTNKD